MIDFQPAGGVAEKKAAIAERKAANAGRKLKNDDPLLGAPAAASEGSAGGGESAS